MLIYTLSNFYPHWYTLIPGSICLGLALGPLWASLNVHITTVAIRFAPNLNETPGYVVALFTGIHTFFIKCLIFTDWKIYMILPMMVLDGFLSSFMLGIFAIS